MSATCEKCGNTGMLLGRAFLDCTNCDIAMIRVGLETWATENGIVADEDELWAIFKYGQSVGLEESAKIADNTMMAYYSGDGASAASSICDQIRALK